MRRSSSSCAAVHSWSHLHGVLWTRYARRLVLRGELGFSPEARRADDSPKGPTLVSHCKRLNVAHVHRGGLSKWRHLTSIRRLGKKTARQPSVAKARKSEGKWPR